MRHIYSIAPCLMCAASAWSIDLPKGVQTGLADLEAPIEFPDSRTIATLTLYEPITVFPLQVGHTGRSKRC